MPLIIGLVVLIASVLIILYFLYRLDLGKTSDQEVCHNSVVLKSKTAGFVGSLDCRTSYVCVSGGSDCANLGYSPNVKVDSTNKEEVMKSLADEMAVCWYEFGEGVDYSSVEDISAFEKVSCGVCSIVEFDANVQKNTKISYQEFYDYLRTTKKTGSQTYLQYLYSTNDLSLFSQDFKPNDYLNNNFNFEKQYFILTGHAKSGFYSPRFLLSWTKSGPFKEVLPQPVVILEKTQENYEKIGCDEFITKA